MRFDPSEEDCWADAVLVELATNWLKEETETEPTETPSIVASENVLDIATDASLLLEKFPPKTLNYTMRDPAVMFVIITMSKQARSEMLPKLATGRVAQIDDLILSTDSIPDYNVRAAEASFEKIGCWPEPNRTKVTPT